MWIGLAYNFFLSGKRGFNVEFLLNSLISVIICYILITFFLPFIFILIVKIKGDSEMKTKISLTLILPAIIFFTFSFQNIYSQIEIDTSKLGPPSQDPTLEDFKDSLSKNGDWVKIDKDEVDPQNIDDEDSAVVDEDVNTEYVWVPSPVLIYVGWSPYCYGQWVWTFWGWEWIPYYDWGWCTYHYGRWWYSNHYGWCWSPGHRWRHSWVSWCHSGGYWGWHPLPPRHHYRHGVAVLPVKKDRRADGWVFVDKKNFKKPIDKTVIVDPAKNREIINGSRQNMERKRGDNTSIPNNKIRTRDDNNTRSQKKEYSTRSQKRYNDYNGQSYREKKVKTYNESGRDRSSYKSSDRNSRSGNNGNRSNSRSNNTGRSNNSNNSSSKGSNHSGKNK